MAPGASLVAQTVKRLSAMQEIPGSGRSPGEGNGNPLHYSCLENSMDGGAWWATVHGVTKSRTRLSDFTSLHLWHSVNDGVKSKLLMGTKEEILNLVSFFLFRVDRRFRD